MDAVRQRGLSAFSLKSGDFEIRIEAQASVAPAAVPAAAPAATAPDTAASPVEETFTGTPVEAPLVGIFTAHLLRRSPFIEVGQTVKKGDTLFIIEAMKTMNEITAPCDGTVSRILAQNGDMVEYKQVLVVID